MTLLEIRIGRVDHCRQVYHTGALCDRILADMQNIASSDHLFHGLETELRHDLTKLLRDEEHEVHNMLRLACKALTQFLILRRDADRTGVLRANTHHHAAHAYKRRRREAELLGA